MALVYRVENKAHIGPYRNEYYPSIMKYVSKRHTDNNHPCPIEDEDINRRMDEEERCGFKDLNQFRSWFNLRDRKLLHTMGFILTIYEAKDIVYGRYQILFNKNTAYKIMEYSLLTRKRT